MANFSPATNKLIPSGLSKIVPFNPQLTRPEIERMLQFRDWLRVNAADRDLYARTKRDLARRDWESVQDYADSKTAVVEEILARARC